VSEYPPPGSYPPPPVPPDGAGSGWAPPPPPPGGTAYPPPPAYTQQGYGWAATPAGPQYAGFWWRALALLIDNLVISAPISLLAFALDPDRFELSAGVGYNPGVSILVNVLSLVAGLLYHGLLEGGPSGQTIGKKVCNIRVVDADTYQPGIGVGRGIGRYFARMLSTIVCLLGYLWMLWDPKKQTWHDKIVSSLVVKA
jgi:uncharacterized RDD family membrane protein YckC